MQQGVTILGRAVLKAQLGPVQAFTPFLVALGVGFDAILGVDFLHEHGISVNLAQHCLVFEDHDSLIVPLVGYHPRVKHVCALTQDVSLRPGARALVRCTCECRRGMARSPGVPEVYLIAARKDHRLGLVIPEQLSSGEIGIQSAADYPLHLPDGWTVAKVRDCQFAFYGPPRLVIRPRRVVNLNRPTRRRNKPRAGKRSQFSLQGRKVGAAQAPARTRNAPSPTSSPVSSTPQMCQRATK